MNALIITDLARNDRRALYVNAKVETLLDFGSDITLGAEGLENARKSGDRTGSEVQFWLQATRDLPRQVELARQSQAPVQRRCLQA